LAAAEKKKCYKSRVGFFFQIHRHSAKQNTLDMSQAETWCIGVAHDGQRCTRNTTGTEQDQSQENGRFCSQHAPFARTRYARYKLLTRHAQAAFLRATKHQLPIDTLKGIYALLVHARQQRLAFAAKFVHPSCRDAGHLWFEAHLETLSRQVEEQLVAAFTADATAASIVAVAAATPPDTCKDDENEHEPSVAQPAKLTKNAARLQKLKERKQTEQLLVRLSMGNYAQCYRLRVEAVQLYQRAYFQVFQLIKSREPDLAAPLLVDFETSDKRTVPAKFWREAAWAGITLQYQHHTNLHRPWQHLLDTELPGRMAIHARVEYLFEEFLNVFYCDAKTEARKQALRNPTGIFSAEEKHE
jgi:hypothetical protein